MSRDKRNFFLLLTLFAVVAVVIYWPARTGGWYFDDWPAIVWNPAYKNLTTAFHQLASPRGLALLTFAIDRTLWGVDPVASRWVNVALHVASSLLVVQLLRQLTGDRGWRTALIGLLFLCHPVQSSAVSYIVQRMAVLSAFFALASIIFADRYFLLTAKERPRAANVTLVFAVLFFLLACMSKENVVLLPAVVLVLAWLRGEGGTMAKGWLQALLACSFIPAAVVAGRLVSAGSASQAVSSGFVPMVDNGGAYYSTLQDTSLLPFRYFLSQLDAFWTYLRLLIFPVQQALDYSSPIPPAVPSPVQVATFLLLTLLCYWVIRQRSRSPLTLFGLVWIFVFMAVESSFLPLDPIFEHRLYLPFFGWGLILYDQSHRLKPRTMQGFLLLFVAGYACLTLQRNVLWGDAVSLWQDNAQVDPRAPRPVILLTSALFSAGRYAEAAEELSTFKDSQGGIVSQRLGEAQYFAGRQAEAFESFRKAQLLDGTLAGLESFFAAHQAIVAGDYVSAERLLALAEKNDARNVLGLYLRGLMAEGKGDIIRAVEFYQKAMTLAQRKNYRMAKFNFDISYGDWAQERRSQLFGQLSGWLAREKAEVDRVPNDVVRRVNWANRLLSLGLYDEAIDEYLSIKRMAPKVWQMLYNLGIAYERIGRLDLAETSYRASLELVPDHAEVQFNYATLLVKRDAKQALSLLEKLMAQNPSDGRNYLAYGEALMVLGEKEKALGVFEQATLLPGYRAEARLLSDMVRSELN